MHVPGSNHFGHAQPASIEPKTLTQRLRCAFLRAPQQSHDPRLFAGRGVCNEILLCRGEIVSDKGLTMGFDQFHIAAHSGVAADD